MNVLVTGGTGFVGSHLIEQLRAGGDRVRALVRPRGDADFARSLGAEVTVGDLDDGDSLRFACEGCEVVYHCAARVEIVGPEREFYHTTVAGTHRLIEAAAARSVRRFVYVSSCGVYHPALLASGKTIDEATPTPEPPRWFAYGRAKYRAERMVMQEFRGEWVVVRLGYLYGPRNRTMHTYLEPVLRDDIMMLIGDGANEMAMVYVEDAARAILLSGRAQGADHRILIAGPTERVTQRQYFDALADGFGIPRITKTVPYTVAYFFGWLGEKIIKQGPRSSVLRRSAIVLTGLPQRINCDATRSTLGWQPRTSFGDGMRKAFEWYHAQYGAKHPR